MYLSQFEDIIAAEEELQFNWGSREARDKLSDAQAILHEVRQQKFQFQESAILSKWARVGDRCTKEFFKFHDGNKKPTPIAQLKDGNTVISTQAELEKHVLAFYEKLYARDDVVEADSDARDECFRHLQRTVTDAHNQELLKPLTQEELSIAIKQLPAGKAPGVDSIPAEFYQAMWGDIDLDIFNFVSESISQSHIAADLNISKIALLPKSEDRSRIQNFRPISLLNTSYKIVAKVYANRMKPLLHHWILPSQTGFVPNRCILDNIFLAFEAIEWTLENNQNLSMLLLDFEKAYDRVNWTFLRQTMTRMGFHPTWINQVMSLNENAAASVVVNGEQSKTFPLQRSVRQGCPLAPYLFLLTVDVLGQMLQHPDYRVQGLRLPDNSSITNQMFVDDTMLFLDGTRDNMDRALSVIHRFGAASGAKLNLHKSVGLWLAHTERTWQWGEEEGLKWLLPGEVTRYLGYPFGLHIPQKEKDGRMLQQIRRHLSKWSTYPLSLAGRIMVSNQVILSSIWYLASCTDLTGKALKTARATVRNYIWSGKRESCARAKVKWDTAVLPIVRGGIKILDPQWQASALLIKLLIRGLSVGYEPWKALVRYRVAQTSQSRRGRWPAHSNWIMNARSLVKQGSSMWQGVMKAWHTIQSGLEQQDPSSWAEIARQPIFGNRFLTNEIGTQWGTEPKSSMILWMEKGVKSLTDIARADGRGWLPFTQHPRFRNNRITSALYSRVLNSIPWAHQPHPQFLLGQWVAAKEEEGAIYKIFHISRLEPLEATVYYRDTTERLHLSERHFLLPTEQLREVRVVCCGGPKHTILEFNPVEIMETEHSLWIWGEDWIQNLEWDPKEWSWRRVGILPETSILNYSTKRGYRVALRQNNHQMKVDAEMEAAGFNSKARAKFFNRIWHPYLPRKVSAMQWLILTEGLPVGAWRERIGLPSHCQLCPTQSRETLQHAFQECSEIRRAWDLYRNLRRSASLPPKYLTWMDISRGLMTEPTGPSIDQDLQWDTAAAFTINMETPWDILRAQLLWAIWCHRVELAFREATFHLGVILWHAWKNTIYCAMEAYKELFRHDRNEEKRQELISCFQKVWTASSIFGRLRNGEIKWNLTPNKEFLPEELGAWNAAPIHIRRLSPSPDLEAEFADRTDFSQLVDDFLHGIAQQGQAHPPEHVPAAHQQNPPSPAEELHSQHNPSLTPSHHSTIAQDEDSTAISSHSTFHLEVSPETEVLQPLMPRDNHRTRPPSSTPQHCRNIQFTPARPGSSKDLSTTKRDGQGKENQILQRIGRATSRPKKRCSRKLSHPSRHIRRDYTEPPVIADDTPPTQEENAPPPSSPTTHLATTQAEGTRLPANYCARPTSRPKVRCRFGPRARGEEDDMIGPPLETHPSPVRVTHAPPSSPGRIDFQSPTHTRTDPEGQPRPPIPPTPVPTHQPADRVTFTIPHSPQRLPFEYYQATAARAPEPDPLRFIHRRLGLTAAAFDALVSQDVDDLLKEIEHNRRQELLEALPFERPLSKEECLRMIDTSAVFTSGTLLGMYEWAADLNNSRLNFDMELTRENIDLLNAYD